MGRLLDGALEIEQRAIKAAKIRKTRKNNAGIAAGFQSDEEKARIMAGLDSTQQYNADDIIAEPIRFDLSVEGVTWGKGSHHNRGNFRGKAK